jgi:hypothetical protein
VLVALAPLLFGIVSAALGGGRGGHPGSGPAHGAAGLSTTLLMMLVTVVAAGVNTPNEPGQGLSTRPGCPARRRCPCQITRARPTDDGAARMDA